MRSQRSMRRSPGAEPGPPPNVPIRSISPAVGITGSVQPRGSTASNRSNDSIERNSGSTKRPSVGSPSLAPAPSTPQLGQLLYAKACRAAVSWGTAIVALPASVAGLSATPTPQFYQVPSHYIANLWSRAKDLEWQFCHALVPNREKCHTPPRRDETTPRDSNAMVPWSGNRHPGV